MALTRGPRSFDDREDMVRAAVRSSPGRSVAAIRRGVIHNTRQLPDGRWGWRYDQLDSLALAAECPSLWRDVLALTMPAMLVRGSDSDFVADHDVDRMRELAPRLRVVRVPGAGHAVQSAQPVALSRLIREFVFDGR